MLPDLGTGHDREPEGTFYLNNEPSHLDQFLINKNMIINDAPIRALPETVEIRRFPGTSATGDYLLPRRGATTCHMATPQRTTLAWRREPEPMARY